MLKFSEWVATIGVDLIYFNVLVLIDGDEIANACGADFFIFEKGKKTKQFVEQFFFSFRDPSVHREQIRTFRDRTK